MVEVSLSELKYPEKFSGFMDQLLNKKYRTTPIRPPHDKGRDSYVTENNDQIKIYQYKYFLTSTNSTQRRNIKESLETALKNYGDKLKEWILCLPREICSSEETFLEKLSKEKDIKISVMGEAEIKNLIEEISFPTENYFESQIHKKNYDKLGEIKEIVSKEDPKKQIKFEVLSKVANHIIGLEEVSEEYAVEPPKDIKKKIKLNNLSQIFEDIFKLQMIKFPQIDNFLLSKVIIEKQINHMLTVLKKIYLKHKSNSQNGDEIFYKMVDEISPNKSNEEEHSAYIAIICYFFHTCEVFEKC